MAHWQTKSPERLLHYNSMDAAITAKVYASMMRELTSDRQRKLLEHNAALSELAARVHRNGFYVHAEQRAFMAWALEIEYEEKRQQLLDRVALPGFEGTPDHVRALIYRRHETATIKRFSLPDPLDERMYTDGGEISVGYKQLLPVVTNPGIPDALKDIVEAWWAAEEVWKARSTFVASELVDQAIGLDGRLRAGWNCLGTDTGRWSCVAKGTLIEVLRDCNQSPKGIPIEDVRPGDMAYTFDQNRRFTLRKVTAAWKTGTKKVIRLHWKGSGHKHTGHLDLTPEHRVRLLSGRYVEAGALQPGDRVMAMSRGLDAYGYGRLWPSGRDEITKEHRFVWDELSGTHAEVVHHRNQNKLDNRLENLEATTFSGHASHHFSQIPTEVRRSAALTSWASGERVIPDRSGERSANWLGLTKEWLEQALIEAGGRMTYVATKFGIDYSTLQKYCRLYGIDFKQIKQSLRNNHEILRVEVLAEEVEVYDLSIEGTECFIANEICVHNCSKPNIQNLPQYLRAMYGAPPGRVLVHADASQLELRVMAAVAEDLELMRRLATGDVYTADAIDWFKLPPDTTKHTIKPSARAQAKEVHLASQYGAGEKTVWLSVLDKIRTFSFKAARLLNKGFLTTYSRTTEYWEEEMERIAATGYSESHILGRRKVFPRMPDRSQAVNYPIQSTAADVANLWMLEVDRRVRAEKLDAFPVHQFHDASDSESCEDDADRVAYIMKDCGKMEHKINGKWVSFPMEVKISSNWADL